MRGVSASPTAESGARLARAEGSSMGTISCVSFFVIQSCEATLCACCRDALCGAECAFDTCMRSHPGSRNQQPVIAVVD